MNGKDGSRRLEKTLCPRVSRRLGKDVMSSGCGDVWERDNGRRVVRPLGMGNGGVQGVSNEHYPCDILN